MAFIEIKCPSAGDHVPVTVQGSGSGSVGTICVHGESSGESLFLRMMKVIFEPVARLVRLIFGVPAVQEAMTNGLTIRVRVLEGSNPPTPSYYPDPQFDTDIPAAAIWCARPVRVPSWSSGGTALTVFAWLLSGTSTGSGSIEAGPDREPFFGGGSPVRDCCAESPCGSGSAPEAALVARELASHPQLDVAVPDGPNAGLHRATAVSYGTWAVTVRGVTYEVCCDGVAALVLRSPSTAAPSTAVERGPFSAIFPGKVVGAVGDVVVTKA